MKEFVGILANKYYHKVNDKFQTFHEIGIMLGEVIYVSDGKETKQRYEIEALRFMVSKEQSEQMIKLLNELEYD